MPDATFVCLKNQGADVTKEEARECMAPVGSTSLYDMNPVLVTPPCVCSSRARPTIRSPIYVDLYSNIGQGARRSGARTRTGRRVTAC